jgi:hypothetical protein
VRVVVIVMFHKLSFMFLIMPRRNRIAAARYNYLRQHPEILGEHKKINLNENGPVIIQACLFILVPAIQIVITLKNLLKLYAFIVLATLVSGCVKLDKPILPKTTDTVSNGGGSNGGSTTANYQPVTKGSSWTYKNTSGGVTDTTYTVMDGNVSVIDGRNFYEGQETYSDESGTQTGYLANEGHVYIDRSTTNSITVNLYYLNDTTAVGHGWVSPINESGYVNGSAGQFVGTIINRNVTKTVEGKTYSQVIHSEVLLQYDFGSGFTTYLTYEVYVANNVGIIEIDSSGLGFTGVETLIAYTIK